MFRNLLCRLIPVIVVRLDSVFYNNMAECAGFVIFSGSGLAFVPFDHDEMIFDPAQHLTNARCSDSHEKRLIAKMRAALPEQMRERAMFRLRTAMA